MTATDPMGGRVRITRDEDDAAYPVWFNEALPLLRHIKDRQNKERSLVIEFLNPPDWETAASETGVSADKLPVTLQNLADDDLIEADVDWAGIGDTMSYTARNVRLLPAGLRELRQWPRREVAPDVFLRLLEKLAEEASPDDEPRVRQFLAAATSVGRDVLVQVLSGMANYGIGKGLGT
jgi:hypothetical protein